MNEWRLNFSVEKKKKKNKKTHKNSGKKIQATFIKKKETSSKSDWMTDELFLKKNSYITRFSGLNEWMTNVLVREKKKYGKAPYPIKPN